VKSARFTAFIAVIAIVATACSAAGGASPHAGSSRRLSGTVRVLAAASLTGAFTRLGKQFQRVHPGTKVAFSFGASSDLATEITQQAPADVFASAAPADMHTVTQAGDATGVTDFVKNRMEIATPRGNPAHVHSVADLTNPGVKVALCEPQAPCGAVAAEVFKNAHIAVKAATLQPDVKSTLATVQIGEVDAGMVYVTDVRAARGAVDGVNIPDSINADTEYPITVLKHSANPKLAHAWVSYVLSPAGQRVLRAAGFLRP
jgi:molybdate transport system substrate-binding protein